MNAPRTTFAAVPSRPPLSETGGVAMVMILLDPSDKIANAGIQTSAGDRRLDNAALTAARNSKFQGQIFRCRHVMGVYQFSVQFT